MKSNRLALFSLLSLVLVIGCSEKEPSNSSGESSPSSSSSSSSSSKEKRREGQGFTVSGPDGLSITCQTAARNMSSPSYGGGSYQLEIMAGWVDPSAAREGAKSFGLGTLFIRFDEAVVGTYALTSSDSEGGVKVRIDDIEAQGLPKVARSVSGELQFEKLEIDENGKPIRAKGSFSGEFALAGGEEIWPMSGSFAIGLKD